MENFLIVATKMQVEYLCRIKNASFIFISGQVLTVKN